MLKFLCVVSCICFLISGPRYTRYVSNPDRKIAARKIVLAIIPIFRFFAWCFLALCLAGILHPIAFFLVPAWIIFTYLLKRKQLKKSISLPGPTKWKNGLLCIGGFVLLIQVENFNEHKALQEAVAAGYESASGYKEAKKLNMNPTQYAELENKRAADRKVAEDTQKAIDSFNNLVSTVKHSCRTTIMDRLKDPDSAKFGASGAEPDLKKGIWVVTREVTAKNAFNANIRSVFRCDISMESGSPKVLKVYEVN